MWTEGIGVQSRPSAHAGLQRVGFAAANTFRYQRLDDVRGLRTAEFAAMTLNRTRKKLKKHGQALADVDDQQRPRGSQGCEEAADGMRPSSSNPLFDDKRGIRRHR